ncbi:MAG: hypothetical protein K0R50_2358, partial [Eubacterium sp.]|nr:hypothetical protein [Eubacterium sp.]
MLIWFQNKVKKIGYTGLNSRQEVNQVVKIRCIVERITYQNPENGYTVLK